MLVFVLDLSGFNVLLLIKWKYHFLKDVQCDNKLLYCYTSPTVASQITIYYMYKYVPGNGQLIVSN